MNAIRDIYNWKQIQVKPNTIGDTDPVGDSNTIQDANTPRHINTIGERKNYYFFSV